MYWNLLNCLWTLSQSWHLDLSNLFICIWWQQNRSGFCVLGCKPRQFGYGFDYHNYLFGSIQLLRYWLVWFLVVILFLTKYVLLLPSLLDLSTCARYSWHQLVLLALLALTNRLWQERSLLNAFELTIYMKYIE